MRSSEYRSINQAVAVAGFERYRNNLISIANFNWELIDSLTSTEIYHIYSTSNSWQIATGAEKIYFGNDFYELYFKIGNYTTSSIKIITTTVKYLNLILEDYFLLPKLNVKY